jgi:hypothetical protein
VITFFVAQVHSLLTTVAAEVRLLDYTALIWGFEILAISLGWCGFRTFSNDAKGTKKRNLRERHI